MRKKNGFFSMSLIYSFFLVFALISAILLANYAHNRLLSKDFNTEIKTNLDDRGDYKLINLHNKLLNSSFETDSPNDDEYKWVFSGVTIVNNQKFDAQRSITFDTDKNSSTLSQKLMNKVVKPEHKYYFQFAYFTKNETVSTTNFQVSLTNNNGKKYDFVNTNNLSFSVPNWKVSGYVVTLPDDDSILNSGDWYFTISKTGSSESNIYLDSFMLIDLSKSYGYNHEPPVDWLNNNLPYFENNYIHNRSDYEG